MQTQIELGSSRHGVAQVPTRTRPGGRRAAAIRWHRKLRVGDYFAGAGGFSEGAKRHRQYLDLVMMLNHSPVACSTHKANNAETVHYCVGIEDQDENDMPPLDILLGAPACQHHSVASGGNSCNPQERAQPEQLPRFIYTQNPRAVIVENVKEILDWGPVEIKRDKAGQPIYKKKLGKDGQRELQYVPIKARKGDYYRDWVAAIKGMGYPNYEYQKMNCADFGTPQSRVRYIGIFTRPGVPIVWPKPTHDVEGRFGLPKWRAVAECLDLTDTGESVFTRRKRGEDDYCDDTLRRLIAGIKKIVVPEFEQQFLASYYSGGGQLGRLCAPCPAVTTNPHARLVTAQLLYQNNGTRANDKPARSCRPVSYCSPVVTTNGGNLYLLTARLSPFVHTYYGFGAVRPITKACPTLTCKDRVGLCQPQRFLFNPAWGGSVRSAARPAPVVVASQDKAPLSVVSPQGFMLRTDWGNGAYPWADAARTIVASRRHQYVVQVQQGCPQLQPKPGDSVVMRLLKALCRRYAIADLFMRMLRVPELKLIMGFPADYILHGTQTEQKMQLGNAVSPDLSEAVIGALLPGLGRSLEMKFAPLSKVQLTRYEQTELFAAAA